MEVRTKAHMFQALWHSAWAVAEPWHMVTVVCAEYWPRTGVHSFPGYLTKQNFASIGSMGWTADSPKLFPGWTEAQVIAQVTRQSPVRDCHPLTEAPPWWLEGLREWPHPPI